jgi:hypothetical protein
MASSWEVLTQWQGKTTTEATWEPLEQFEDAYPEFKLRTSYFTKGEAVSWTPSSISSTRAGGSPSRIKGPLVATYQLVDLLEYSVSTP